MKCVIALKHSQTNLHGNEMLNIAYHYGLMYLEYDNNMLFFFKEELADKRTAYFFGDILCAIFQTDYANRAYAYPTAFKPQPQISIAITVTAAVILKICCPQRNQPNMKSAF